MDPYYYFEYINALSLNSKKVNLKTKAIVNQNLLCRTAYVTKAYIYRLYPH